MGHCGWRYKCVTFKKTELSSLCLALSDTFGRQSTAMRATRGMGVEQSSRLTIAFPALPPYTVRKNPISKPTGSPFNTRLSILNTYHSQLVL